ncbi:MAG: aminoglycoside phosphotransferase family protein [Ardenticatenaceae bacterium]|nr:aminoglycoside phosphotransferase family protein [Ardenticatenaceae bacterium]
MGSLRLWRLETRDWGERTAFLPGEVSWQNWGSFFLEADLWRPLVRRICEVTAVTSAQHIEAGFPGSCAVFVVDGQVVVKLYPPMMAGDFYRERAVYGLLDGRLPHLPRLLGEGVYPDQLDWPFLLLAFCEGVAIREVFEVMAPDNRLAIAREVGEMLRVVHETAVETLPGNVSTTWAEFVANRRANCLAELRQKEIVPESVLAECADFLARVEVGGERPILINADLTEDHLLLVPHEGQWRISALIDWADTEVGAREYEWIALWFGLCQRDGAMFREILRVYDADLRLDDDFYERVLAYTLLHRFGAAIIEHVWGENGRPAISTLAALRQQLWGPLLAR